MSFAVAPPSSSSRLRRVDGCAVRPFVPKPWSLRANGAPWAIVVERLRRIVRGAARFRGNVGGKVPSVAGSSPGA
jgi:hypothetical protein